MGMFDWVNYEVSCPKCNHIVSGFQTKDGNCNLETFDYWQCDEFYSICENCKLWILYRRNKDIPFCPITDYEMIYEKDKK